MPYKVYMNQVTRCCFLVNFFIARKTLAIFVSSYRTKAESYVHLRSIRHKPSRKVTADDLRMAIAYSLLHREINFKAQVSLPLNDKLTTIKLLKLWEICLSNYIWLSGVLFRSVLLEPLEAKHSRGLHLPGRDAVSFVSGCRRFGVTCAFVCSSRQSIKWPFDILLIKQF